MKSRANKLLKGITCKI
uniref:Uncharacterized protein n=1 Tax=Rhizophora mucronata TaxID=61149 RepID=A0A2P2QSW1_RHIMU